LFELNLSGDSFDASLTLYIEKLTGFERNLKDLYEELAQRREVLAGI